MSGLQERGDQTWSVGWVILVRLLFSIAIIGFLLQYAYFNDDQPLQTAGESIVLLVAVFISSIVILVIAAGSPQYNYVILFTYMLDIIVLTRVIMVSGGFRSVLFVCYLPILVMAPTWLPRRYTAVFPSIATLAISYVGLGHLLVSEGDLMRFASFFPDGTLHSFRVLPAHITVTYMLLITLLFFMVSYISGIVSGRFFLAQRLNHEVISSMHEGVAIVDARKKLVYSNSEFGRLFPQVRRGEEFDPFLRRLFPDMDEKNLLDALLTQGSSEYLVLSREQDKWLPPVEFRISAITLFGDNAIFGLVVLVSDLSLRKHMESVERELAHFTSISTMAAGLAHEIRNPLASLRSAIQEIGEAFPPDSQNRMLTDIVIAESDRLDGVIGRFLNFSREEQLRLSRCRLSGLVRDIHTLVLRGKEHDLEINVDVTADPEIVCDSDRVHEVLLNLILNASQMAPKPGGKIHITQGVAERDGVAGIRITVRDNGPGIPEGEMGRIFDPFYTKRQGGTGMGLTISRKQVTMHGGELTVANHPEGGAVFQVWLPQTVVMQRRAGSKTRFGHSRIVKRKTSGQWKSGAKSSS